MVSDAGNPLRIALGPEIWAGQKFGGISRYFYEIALALTKENVDILLIVPQGYDGYFPLAEINTLSVKNFRDFRRVLKELGRGGYLYHATYYNSKNLRYAREFGLKTVVTVFDYISEKFPEPKPRFRRTVNEKSASIELANRVISISQNTRIDLLQHSNIDPRNVSVISLASSFSSHFDKLMTNHTRKNLILYVGKREGYKNFQTLLKAFAHSPVLRNDMQLIAFGGGNFSEQEFLDISSLGVSGLVVDVQGTDENLRNLYLDAKIFVYPSLYEGFGLPLLEAMSLGCPVLASNTSSMPEVCGAAALYFNPENLIELSQLLETTLSNQPLLERLASLGFSRSAEFSWEKTASHTLNVYQELQQEILFRP